MKAQAELRKALPSAALFKEQEGLFLPGLSLVSVSIPSSRTMGRKGG